MAEETLNRFTVKEGEHEMEVVIPRSGDLLYDRYLEEAEREKTKEQLRKKPPKVPATPQSKQDLAEATREMLEYRNRKKYGTGNKKYY